MINVCIHIAEEGIRTVRVQAKEIVFVCCLLTKDDADIITRDHRHLHLIGEIAKIGIVGSTGMKKSLRRLSDIIPSFREGARSVIVICAQLPVPALTVVYQRIIEHQISSVRGIRVL